MRRQALRPEDFGGRGRGGDHETSVFWKLQLVSRKVERGWRLPGASPAIFNP